MSRSEERTMQDVADVIENAPGDTKEVKLLLSREGIDDSVSQRNGVHSRKLRLSLPGWHLVTRQDEGGDISDAICINSRYNPHEIWGQIMVAGGPTIHSATGVATAIVRASVGYVRYILPSLGVGVRGGYQFARYNLISGVASWQDLDVNSPAIKWQRHALVIGPLIEARSRFTRLPFEFRTRLSPFLDLGVLWIPAKTVPVSLSEFRGGSTIDNLVDLDGGIDVDFMISHEVGNVQLQYGLTMSLLAFDDNVLQTAVTARQNFAGVFGFTFAIGRGDPRRRR